jgi:hypothetical protein
MISSCSFEDRSGELCSGELGGGRGHRDRLMERHDGQQERGCDGEEVVRGTGHFSFSNKVDADYR